MRWTILFAIALSTAAIGQKNARVVLEPGLAPVQDHRKVVREIPAPNTPTEFQPLFNGNNLDGWHISQSSNHGVTPLVVVRDGMIIATQNPAGQGGLLVSDASFANFELHLEVRSDWGNDSGLLFRVTEAGAGYQITMDTLDCGSVGRLEGAGGVQTEEQKKRIAPPCWVDDPGHAAWKRNDWNVVKIRVEGEAPQTVVHVNGILVAATTDTENRAVDRQVSGPIALQIHGGVTRWQPGGFWRWRSIAIKRL